MKFKYLSQGEILLSRGEGNDRSLWGASSLTVRDGLVVKVDGDCGVSVGTPAIDIPNDLIQVYRTSSAIFDELDLVRIGITGHRPDKLGGYGKNKISDWVSETVADAILSFSLEDTAIEIVTGMAQGADQKAAWEAHVMSKQSGGRLIRVIAAVPYPEQAERWPQAAKDHWAWLLEHAADETYVTSAKFEPWALEHRNRFVVNRSAKMIAVWDGSEGGTKNCIDLAKRKGLKIWRIDPITRKIGWYEYDPPIVKKKKEAPPEKQLRLFE